MFMLIKDMIHFSHLIDLKNLFFQLTSDDLNVN